MVEDEYLIRMLLEDMLADLGYAVAAAAGSARAKPRELAGKTAEFDLAILDVNIDGEEVFPVADILAARGMPFVFVTGYGGHGLPETYRSRPTLQKPFQIEDLKSHARARWCPPAPSYFASNSAASCVMNGSSVMSSRSGVTEILLSASARRSVPCPASAIGPRAEGDPEIRIAAAVVARIDAQQFLVALALLRDRDAGHFVGRAIRES